MRLYHQIRYLSSSHEIILVSLAQKPFDSGLLNALKKYCTEIYVLPFGRLSAIKNTAMGLLRGLPVNVGYFYNRSLRQRVESIIEKTRPDAIFVQLIRMVPYVRNLLSIPMALDYMDSFSLRSKRRGEKSSMLGGLFWYLESKLLQNYERKANGWFEIKYAIAKLDASLLEDAGIDGLNLLPNGIDTKYFDPHEVAASKEYDLVFVGNMSYHPNIVAVRYLIEKIARPLREDLPNLKVLLAGAAPAKEVLQFATNWITVTGHLDDIRTAYASARVFVAPIFTGSGMQNKILEAVAMKLPCITTPQVIDGIGLPTQYLYSATTAKEFRKKILDIYRNGKDGMKGDARKYIVEHYDWNTACKSLELLAQLKH